MRYKEIAKWAACMVTCFVLLAMTVFATYYIICLNPFVGAEPKKQVQEVQQEEKERFWADNKASKIRYIRDERTGLCFAFYGHNNAPSLAEVPYEKVKHVLLNPIVEAEKSQEGKLSE